MVDKLIENKNKQVMLELALFLNSELLNDDVISYQMYKKVEDLLCKRMKE